MVQIASSFRDQVLRPSWYVVPRVAWHQVFYVIYPLMEALPTLLSARWPPQMIRVLTPEKRPENFLSSRKFVSSKTVVPRD